MSTRQRYLYLAEFWYNTSYHSSINMTPFKAMYGREVTSIHHYIVGSNATASIDSSLTEHQRLVDMLKVSLQQCGAPNSQDTPHHRIYS